MKPFLLVILDGFGHNPSKEGNAVAQARMPFYASLNSRYPHTVLNASSEQVGLPPDTMGNSEVGHLNIGAGRVVYQTSVRINSSISDGSFFSNKTLADFLRSAKKDGKTIHLMGLLSDASVHSHISHLISLIKLANSSGVKAAIHLFTDGRDMDPHSSKSLVQMVMDAAKGTTSSIATISGRYYAMDRDKRWDRTAKAYAAITEATGLKSSSPEKAVEEAYARKESDEFIEPTIIGNYAGMQPGDYAFFFNFRADRARQMCIALSAETFGEFARPKGAFKLATMASYDAKALPCPVAFPELVLKNTLSEVVSAAGLKQLHVAETEKYAHVTYFFNGGNEKPFPGEERTLIPSKKVATYDLSPEMSAPEITDAAIEGLSKGHSFVLVNLANPDMVGHTGNFEATKKALETVDGCIEKLAKAAKKAGFTMIITADHGNCEEMTAGLTTAHTKNKVPLILLTEEKITLREGALSDVAPTILKLSGLEQPPEMIGKSLF